VTFVQRFGGLVNLNVHFHLVVPDGVFVDRDEGLRFEMLPVPTNANVLTILDRIMRRIARRLAKDAASRDLDEDAAPDVLAQIQAEAASTWRTPANASASRPVRGAEKLRAWCEGFSLHAGVVIAEHDRDALERLCRYGARPAFALERLAWTDDGRISYKLKRPWPDGRTHLVMVEPVAFLRRLVGIIPPPRRHLVRYSGVFGPASKHRAKLCALVPTDIDAAPKAACGGGGASTTISTAPSSRSRRLPWADLLRHVFADDVLQCPCDGRRSVIAVVTDPALANTLLAALGVPSDPVTFAPARSPPQAELAWDEAS
jgi:hypothetical protein